MGHEIPLSPVPGSAAVNFQDGVPAVGLVEVRMSPLASTTAHRLVEGQETPLSADPSMLLTLQVEPLSFEIATSPAL